MINPRCIPFALATHIAIAALSTTLAATAGAHGAHDARWPATPTSVMFPLHASANGHYLVDAGQSPLPEPSLFWKLTLLPSSFERQRRQMTNGTMGALLVVDH